MSAQCQACKAPARDGFICRKCTSDLRDTLYSLAYGPQHPNGQRGPGWLELLADAAVGHTRMDDGGGRRSAPRRLKGSDDALADCAACGHPRHIDAWCSHLDDEGYRDCECWDYIADSGAVLNYALRIGRVNSRAAKVRDRIHNMLTTTLRDICETRGVPLRDVRAVPPDFIGPPRNGSIRCEYRGETHFCALWLAENASAIAAGEGAGHTVDEIARAVKDIEQVINRPVPIRDLGRCPTWNDDTREACGMPLRARADAIEVYCRACRQTHRTDRLQLQLADELARAKVTVDEVLLLNRVLPEDFRINERRLRRWRSPGPKGEPPKLKARGYLRPCSCGHGSKHHDRHRNGGCTKCDCASHDGREVISQHGRDDEVLYAWADIRDMRPEQWKAKAG